MSVTQISPVKRLVDRFQQETKVPFRPNQETFEAIGINRIRFGQLVRGKYEPSTSEIKLIATFFGKFFPCNHEDLLN